jgi:hypothetical protein
MTPIKWSPATANHYAIMKNPGSPLDLGSNKRNYVDTY